jgi:hypothetical protein
VRPLTIPTRELLQADVPERVEPFDPAWQQFALSYPGYAACGGHERLAPVANREMESWERGVPVEADLIDLRARLFFEQRREHFAGGWGDPVPYVEALVAAIREAVAGGAADVEDPPGALPHFPAPLHAESAASAEWWQVGFDLGRRFAVDGPLDPTLWVAHRGGRPWLIRALEFDGVVVLPFVDRGELERFVLGGTNLDPGEED